MTIVKHSQDSIKYISHFNLNFFNTINRKNLSRFLTTSPWDENKLINKR